MAVPILNSLFLQYLIFLQLVRCGLCYNNFTIQDVGNGTNVSAWRELYFAYVDLHGLNAKNLFYKH